MSFVLLIFSTMGIEAKKKDLTDRLLAISGEKYLNDVIPIAMGFIAIKNSNRLKLLEELIEAGCDDEVVYSRLKIETINQFELAIIASELNQMYRDNVCFLN